MLGRLLVAVVAATASGFFPQGVARGPVDPSRGLAPRRSAAEAEVALLRAFDYGAWCASVGVDVSGKVAVETMSAAAAVEAMEVLARVPRDVCVGARADRRWPVGLTLAALSRREDPWVQSWDRGGWITTDKADLDARDAKAFEGPLLVIGSDNDAEIYKKFGLKCHPFVDRAAHLAAHYARSPVADARAALVARSAAFRAVRDELIEAVRVPRSLKGSMRERRQVDAAVLYSRVLAHTALVDGDACVVPVFERFLPVQHEHEEEEDSDANAKVVADPTDPSTLLVIATRAVAAGERLTRDVRQDAPPMPDADATDPASPLSLLLRFGLKQRRRP